MAAGRKTIVGLAALAVVAVVAGAIAGGAAATRSIHAPSRISIASKELGFHGRVSTGSYPSCREQRRVTLFKAVHAGPDEAVGRAITDDRGRWSVTVSGFAGISLTPFYAMVRRSSQGTAGTIYVCDAARSRTIKLGP